MPSPLRGMAGGWTSLYAGDVLKDRRQSYVDLEAALKAKVLVYVTGDRPGLESQVSQEATDYFVHHLDAIGPVSRIALYLYTRGGQTLAAWSIANLLQQFCDELIVVVPAKAHSAGTLLCLSADHIVMTKQATLGPIDPSVNGPLNPQVAGAGPQVRVPVSVEAINSFIEFVRDTAGTEAVPAILSQLATQVHPLVLGDAYRSRTQIRMLAKRLISRQLTDEPKVDKVLDFLCSESGSHDYAIYRREAQKDLELNIRKPSQTDYAIIKSIYDDIASELELTTPFDPAVVLGGRPVAPYAFRRGLVESLAGGCHVFVTEGSIKAVPPGPAAILGGIQNQTTFEGWRHEP